MNITFLIGNGFDRQMGLDTGYNQFLEWYIKQPSENESIKEYKDALEADPKSAWWSDAEIAMGKYAGEFESEHMGKYYERIRDFKIRLAEYLRMQQNRCDYSDKNRIGSAFIAFISFFHKDIILQDKVGDTFEWDKNINYNFITFNYTNVVKNLLNAAREKGSFIFTTTLPGGKVCRGVLSQYVEIHGSLETQIIMGVNDESQINLAKEQIDNTIKRTLVKPQINTALGRQEDTYASYLIEQSEILVIYGLKLGETDKKWRTIIAKWLKANGKKVVIFDHKKLEGINRHIPEDLLNYVDKKQTAFLKLLYPDITPVEIEFMRDKVFVIDKTSYLDFNILKESDSNEEKDLSEINETENLMTAS